jgi:hypothetical protein
LPFESVGETNKAELKATLRGKRYTYVFELGLEELADFLF